MQRRDFIKTSGKIAGTVALASMIPGIASCSNTIDKIQVGLIGCRGMGFSDLKSFMKKKNVDVIALCDVDQKVLEIRGNEVEKTMGKRPILYSDFRKLLENKDINTVIIGTPDHWHAIMLIYALEAGKHVLVEKPMGHSIEENRAMVQAVQNHPDLKVQVNMWQRSSQHWFDAMDYVKSGALGEIGLTRAWIYKGYGDPIQPEPDSSVPEHVDYDMWLGPAKKRPFNTLRFHYNFRWFWDYAGGTMTDWGVHLLDFAMLGMNVQNPLSIAPGGGLFQHAKNSIETPDIQQVAYNYAHHTMLWECGLLPGAGLYGRSHGVAFNGSHGTLVVNRSGWEVIPDKKKGKDLFEAIPNQKAVGGLDEHVDNLIAAIKHGDPLHCDAQTGAKVAIVSEMGNIAYRVKEVLHWDEEKGLFDKPEANKLISLNYREPWKLHV